MKRRTSTTPVKVWTYGCRGGSKAITEGHLWAEEQFRYARLYKRKLVELELQRRAEARAVIATDTTVAELDTEITAKDEALEALRAAAKTVNATNRRRAVSAEDRARIRAAAAELKALRAKRKIAKSEAQKLLETQLKPVDEAHTKRMKEARAASNLFWGTYLALENAADQYRKGRDPKLDRFNDREQLVVQLQHGLKGTDIESDRRIQLVPIPETTRRRGKHLATFRLRVGSNPDRTPRFVGVQTVVHRELPPDAVITWARLLRIRDGRYWRYQVQLTVESSTFVSSMPGQLGNGGAIAVDLGWRVASKGLAGLRVGYWRDDRGNKAEVRLAPEVLSAIDYPEQIFGVETKWFETMRDQLSAWIKAHPEALPPEHAERLANVGLWQKARKLASRVWWWKDHRFSGDEEIFAALSHWRVRRFWHYRDWSRNQREKALGRRLDFYRVQARKILVGYSTLILEDFDLRTFARKESVESETHTPTPRRFWQKMAAPSVFRNALIAAATSMNIKVVKKDCAYTTQMCGQCGATETWDAEPAIMHTCASCGATWDQDDNACVNLLREDGVLDRRLDAAE